MKRANMDPALCGIKEFVVTGSVESKPVEMPVISMDALLAFCPSFKDAFLSFATAFTATSFTVA